MSSKIFIFSVIMHILLAVGGMADVVLCFEADGRVALELAHNNSSNHSANSTNPSPFEAGWNAERSHAGSCLDIAVFASEKEDYHTYTKNIYPQDHLAVPINIVSFSSSFFEPTNKSTVSLFSPENNSTLSSLRTLILQV